MCCGNIYIESVNVCNNMEGKILIVRIVEREDVLHALGAAPFVAVVEIETFALQDECADAVLRW